MRGDMSATTAQSKKITIIIIFTVQTYSRQFLIFQPPEDQWVIAQETAFQCPLVGLHSEAHQ